MNEASNSDAMCKECATVEVKKFEVTFNLPEKYWYEDIKRYVFKPSNRQDLIISEIPEVKIEITSELWRITDMLYSDEIKHVEIRRIN